MMHTVYVRDDGEAIPAVSAAAQAWAACILAEAYLKYLRYVCVNSECDCSLGEDETCSHLAAMLRREILPALKPLYRVAVDAAVGRRAWKALAAMEDEENEAQRDHAYDAEGLVTLARVAYEAKRAALAAAGLERAAYEAGLAMLEQEMDAARQEASAAVERTGYEAGLAVLQRVVDEVTLALSHTHPTV